MFTQDDSAELQRAITDAIRTISQDAPQQGGWLALDCAEMLLDLASGELAGLMTDAQREAIERAQVALRAVSVVA